MIIAYAGSAVGNALVHGRLALSALHADSSIAVRLKRYNHHMALVLALEAQGSAQ